MATSYSESIELSDIQEQLKDELGIEQGLFGMINAGVESIVFFNLIIDYTIHSEASDKSMVCALFEKFAEDSNAQLKEKKIVILFNFQRGIDSITPTGLKLFSEEYVPAAHNKTLGLLMEIVPSDISTWLNKRLPVDEQSKKSSFVKTILTNKSERMNTVVNRMKEMTPHLLNQNPTAS